VNERRNPTSLLFTGFSAAALGQIGVKSHCHLLTSSDGYLRNTTVKMAAVRLDAK
jgi:hypothetical protein